MIISLRCLPCSEWPWTHNRLPTAIMLSSHDSRHTHIGLGPSSDWMWWQILTSRAGSLSGEMVPVPCGWPLQTDVNGTEETKSEGLLLWWESRIAHYFAEWKLKYRRGLFPRWLGRWRVLNHYYLSISDSRLDNGHSGLGETLHWWEEQVLWKAFQLKGPYFTTRCVIAQPSQSVSRSALSGGEVEAQSGVRSGFLAFFVL